MDDFAAVERRNLFRQDETPKRKIADHGVIGNLSTMALVATDGAIDFLCWPRFDSPSIFAAILDEAVGGVFELAPEIADARVVQTYLPDSNVLITRWLGAEASAEITGLMTGSVELGKFDAGAVLSVPVMSLPHEPPAFCCLAGFVGCGASAADFALASLEAATDDEGGAPFRVVVQHPPDIVLPSALRVADPDAPLSTVKEYVLPEHVQLPPGVHIGQLTCDLPFAKIWAG